jgi:small subunit ribosomal protein S20
MANRKAKIKTIEVSQIRRDRNRSNRTLLNSQLRKLDDAVAKGDKSGAETELKQSLSRLDKSVTVGIIHKNKAARSKSRLCARVAAMA